MKQVISDDGYPEWQVKLDVTGVEGAVTMNVYGHTEDAAIESAMELFCMIKHNDIGVIGASPLINMYDDKI